MNGGGDGRAWCIWECPSCGCCSSHRQDITHTGHRVCVAGGVAFVVAMRWCSIGTLGEDRCSCRRFTPPHPGRASPSSSSRKSPDSQSHWLHACMHARWAWRRGFQSHRRNARCQDFNAGKDLPLIQPRIIAAKYSVFWCNVPATSSITIPSPAIVSRWWRGERPPRYDIANPVKLVWTSLDK
jgi:hypothetical protein